MRYVFKHEYRQNHSTLLDITGLLFTWIQKHSKETENRDNVVLGVEKIVLSVLGKNGPVFLWEFMDQVRTYRFWPIGQGKEERDEWFPTQTEQSFYYRNNLTNFSTVHWQMWAFKTMLRSSKFLLACQSNTLLENTGRNIREAFIRAKMV